MKPKSFESAVIKKYTDKLMMDHGAQATSNDVARILKSKSRSIYLLQYP